MKCRFQSKKIVAHVLGKMMFLGILGMAGTGTFCSAQEQLMLNCETGYQVRSSSMAFKDHIRLRRA